MLTKLHGVGPAFEQILHSQGITTIDQLAGLPDHPLSVVARAFKHFSRDTEGDGRDAIVVRYCRSIRTNPPTVYTNRSIIKRVQLADNVNVILKVIRDPDTIQRSTKSIELLWKTTNSKKRLKGTALSMSSHFVTIYDMFSDNGFLYIVMEALDGDGMDFMTKFRGDVPTGNLPSVTYMKSLSTMWRGLTIGIIEGLFNNDLFFSDIKPENVAYNQNKDGTLEFKWIDVECIASHTTGCYQIDYIDPYHFDFELQKKTHEDYGGDEKFYTDLWKIGLSVLTMLIGYNPVSRLLDEMCSSGSDVAMYRYMEENISEFKRVVDDERKRVLGLPDVPIPLQLILRHLLEPIGKNRFKYMTGK